MKVLLDENLPHDLRHFIAGHEVFTVAYMGWAGIENGALLKKASDAGFDAILTQDSGVQHEHNPASLPISVVLLRAKSSKLDDLRPLVPMLLNALESLTPRTLVRIG